MARKRRFDLIGVPQHVIQCGHNRENCFFSENDYLVYLDSLAESAQNSECEIHTYVLMANHVHLLLTPQASYSVPAMMQALGPRYVRYVNREYRRTGTLWEGRYKACLVEPWHFLLLCSRYIETNAVRAAVAKHPRDYRWSSYRHNALGETSLVVGPHPEFLRLGVTPSERQRAYRDMFQHPINSISRREIRDALNHELVLGSEKYKSQVEQLVKRNVRPGKVGR